MVGTIIDILLSDDSRIDGKPAVRDRRKKLKTFGKTISGEDFCSVLISSSHPAETVEEAEAAGEALLDARLARRVTDDGSGFSRDSSLYRLSQDFDSDDQASYDAITSLMNTATRAGYLDVRSKTGFFTSKTNWHASYCVLTEAESSEDDQTGKFHVFSHKSSDKALATYRVQECSCSVTECESCRTGSYCFTLVAASVKSKHHTLTLCASNSKAQEGWLESLMNAGVELRVEDEDPIDASSLHELSARDLDTGESIPMSRYKGKVGAFFFFFFLRCVGLFVHICIHSDGIPACF